eukprot:4576145-Amphidinium_carterae.1
MSDMILQCVSKTTFTLGENSNQLLLCEASCFNRVSRRFGTEVLTAHNHKVQQSSKVRCQVVHCKKAPAHTLCQSSLEGPVPMLSPVRNNGPGSRKDAASARMPTLSVANEGTPLQGKEPFTLAHPRHNPTSESIGPALEQCRHHPRDVAVQIG